MSSTSKVYVLLDLKSRCGVSTLWSLWQACGRVGVCGDAWCPCTHAAAFFPQNERCLYSSYLPSKVHSRMSRSDPLTYALLHDNSLLRVQNAVCAARFPYDFAPGRMDLLVRLLCAEYRIWILPKPVCLGANVARDAPVVCGVPRAGPAIRPVQAVWTAQICMWTRLLCVSCICPGLERTPLLGACFTHVYTGSSGNFTVP